MAIEKILVVDDNEGKRKFVCHLLKREGYFVEEAASAESALESLRLSRPDLVITKLFTCQGEGIALVRRIRDAVGASIMPILAYTPITDQAKLEALENGVNDFLTRPFHAIELLARTRALLVSGQTLRRIAEMRRTTEEKIRERTKSLERALSVQRVLLAQSERVRRELELTINAMGDAVVITDADGRIKRATGTAGVLLNQKPHELVGRSCSEFLADGVLCPHHLLSEACASAEAEAVSHRHNVRLRICVYRIPGIQGNLIGFAHLLSDLTSQPRDQVSANARAAYVPAGRIAH
jgi:DNA-binding response OmpR family regulator